MVIKFYFRIYLLVILTTSLFYSCENLKTEIQKDKMISSVGYTFPVILDTLSYHQNLKIESKEETWISTSFNKPLYLGLEQDTIFANYWLSSPPPPPSDSDEYFEVFLKLMEEYKNRNQDNRFESFENNFTKNVFFDLLNLQIKVDTATKIPIDFSYLDSTTIFSYPVLIKNLDNTNVEIGFGEFIPAFLEAKDSIGNWRAIEEPFSYMCGTGLHSIILPPNYVALTNTRIYYGDYHTDLRIKLGNSYSNTFKGNINYRQFQSMFNEHGNYREEYLDENPKFRD